MLYLSNSTRFSPQIGLTLPEVLITLVIVAVLLTVATPAMKSLIASQRISAIAREVHGSFMLARSEAVKRRTAISLCKTTNGTTCSASGNDWDSGWLVFTDADSDGVLEAGDELIKVFAALPDDVSLVWNQGNDASFDSRGQARLAGTFSLCEPTPTGDEVRELVLSLTGRLRVQEQGSC